MECPRTLTPEVGTCVTNAETVEPDRICAYLLSKLKNTMSLESSPLFPKVDISNYETRKEQVSKELGEAARGIGFFYVTGHGISEERIQRAFELGKQWFALSNEEKTNYKLDLTEYVGWKGERLLLAGDDKPKLEQMIFGHPAENNPYANKLEEQAKEVVPGIEDFTREFMDDLLQISRVILRGLALALGVPEDFFVAGLERELPDIAGGGGWNHYLPFSSKSRDTEFRIPAHADAELFTLLFQQQGQPGLEVTPGRAFFDTANSGKPFLKNYEKVTYPDADALKYYPMPPVPGAITVNVGDFLMRYSDGEFLSTYHRVRSPAPGNGIPEGERYTLVYFAQPARSTVVQGPRRRWPPILAGEDTHNMAVKHYDKVNATYFYGQPTTLTKQQHQPVAVER